MHLVLHEDHFQALIDSGYKQRGHHKFGFSKIIKSTGKRLSYFHAIVDYYNRSISIHIDTHKNGSSKHTTVQKDPRIISECQKIKNNTLTGKLELIRDKYINQLIVELKKLN